MKLTLVSFFLFSTLLLKAENKPFSLELTNNSSRHLINVKEVKEKTYNIEIFYEQKIMRLFTYCSGELGAPEGINWTLSCEGDRNETVNIQGNLVHGRIEVKGLWKNRDKDLWFNLSPKKELNDPGQLFLTSDCKGKEINSEAYYTCSSGVKEFQFKAPSCQRLTDTDKEVKIFCKNKGLILQAQELQKNSKSLQEKG